MRREGVVCVQALTDDGSLREECHLSTAPGAAAPPTVERTDGLDAEGNKQHRVSITISPAHLLLKVVELTGEVRLSDSVGLAGVFGAGSVEGLTVLELGAQVRVYVLGSFIHGLQLGAEVLGLNLSGGIGGGTAQGFGLSVAPFIGYKIATNVGFTFELQAGPAISVVGATVMLPGWRFAFGTSQLSPLVNLNVGWSF